MRAHANLHVARPFEHGHQQAQEAQGILDRMRHWFLPHKETRLMADEAQRTGGLFLPYPLLGIMMTVILVLGGGIIGMYVKVDTLSTTLIMQNADYQRERQQAWDKIEQLQVYINNDRERLIRVEEQQKKLSRQ